MVIINSILLYSSEEYYALVQQTICLLWFKLLNSKWNVKAQIFSLSASCLSQAHVVQKSARDLFKDYMSNIGMTCIRSYPLWNYLYSTVFLVPWTPLLTLFFFQSFASHQWKQRCFTASSTVIINIYYPAKFFQVSISAETPAFTSVILTFSLLTEKLIVTFSGKISWSLLLHTQIVTQNIMF